MDSYSKDLHLRDKDYVPDIPTNELSSLEGDHQESQPRFSVDEPLEVQLRFDLGSLVDAQDLLDTHGPRESHWDFMRQEQGRFQTSSEENTALLVHDKQDDLKSFDNCEGWPRSTSQMDTQLFIDAQDDVSMITEAFEGKDRSISHPVEEDRSLLLPSYRHREEAAAWIGEDRKVLVEGKAQGVDNSCREGIANGAIEASQISTERPDTRGACESCTELSPHPEDIQVQTNENNENQEVEESASDSVIEPLVNLEQMKTNENNENQEVEQSASDLVIEPLVNLEQRTEDKAASLTVSEPQYKILSDAFEEAEVKQDLPLDSSNDNRAISVQLDASTLDDLEVSAQTEMVILTENVNRQVGQTMDAQDSCCFEEQSKVTALEMKVDATISESAEKDNKAGHISSNVAEEMQETGAAPVIHSHVIFGPTMDAEDSRVFEEQSNMTALETKVDDETISAISESMEKDNEAGHILSNVAEDMQETGTALDIHCHVTFGHTTPNLERETSDMLPEDMQETGTSPVIHSHVTFCHTSPNSERETPNMKPDTGEKQSTPGGICLESESTLQISEVTVVPDSDEKQSASGLPCSKEDFISQGSEGVAMSNISVLENSKETSLPSNENVDGMIVATVRSCRDLEKIDEAECRAGDGLDAQGQTTYKIPGIEHVDTNIAGEKGAASMELSTVEQQVICLEPAASALKQDAAEVCTASVLEQDAADICTGARRLENTSLCNNMEQEENTQGIDIVADLSVVTPDISLKETTAKKISETTQTSVVHDDSLKPSDYGMQSKDHAAEDNGNSGQENEHRDAISIGLTVKHTSLVDEFMIEKIEAKGVDESLPTVGSEASIQERSMKHHSGDQSYSISSAKPNLLNGENISGESFHPGGVLHVLLDVHTEGASDDSVPKDREHVERIASKRLPDVQTFNTSDATRKDSGMAGEVSAGISDTYVSGLTGMAATSGSQEDEQLASTYTTTPQDKVSKRKSDPATRNNRLKDSARASPLQVRSDQEQKNAGKEGLGKRKTTPKSAPQKKGTETLEGFSSPKKSASMSASGRKKGISPPMVQDAMVSPVAKEVFQSPANISKSVLSVNARQHGVPDLNGSDIAVPMALPAQPFSEPQQVQLRAQILVYGSLIQGAAPEEALMIAAFSNVTGGAREPEASGRAVWEKQWQASVERIHAKSTRDTLRDSRGSGVLVSNLPVTSAKASEGDLKANSSPGVANSTIDARNVAGLHPRVSDIPGTKVHPSRPRHSADPGFGISVSRSNQSAAVVVPPGPSFSTALRSVSSPLSDNLTQSSKSRVDLQQITPQTYYPAPPLGPFLTGAPQWLPTASFSGPWQPQTQAAVYNTPSALFTHAQAVVNSDQVPEMRRNTPASSGTIVPVNPIIPTLFTPVMGPLSGTPTSAADPVQKRQPVSESRPRKRKKIQSEIYFSATDVVPNAAFMVGSQATAVSDLPAGQAGLAISSPVNLLSLTSPESLAMVVVNTQIPKTSQETSIVTTHASKDSVPNLTNMLNVATPVPTIDHGLVEKSTSSQNSTSQLAQAQRSAEEAASAAASAVRESESLWCQLKAQKNTGLTSDMEMRLVSSAVAVATAASVAKAAAAAANAAYEAAVQAKMISEDALGCGKQGDESESFRLLQDKADNVSQTCGIPESCNSIMAAAKMASKKRLEAVSAARVRAQNFDFIVRAAELASNAVTQVGSVMAMGESVPFTLEMLMEAGPEGFHRLLSLGTSEDKDETTAKGTVLQSPGKKGTPKQKGSIEKDKRPSKKIASGIKEASVQREAQVDSRTTDSVMSARPENDARINADVGEGLMVEKTNDQLAVYMQAPQQGLTPIRTEDGLPMQPEDSIIDNQIVKGSPVEVMSDEKGLRGVWFSARVQNVDGGKVFVLYDDLLSDDGFSPLEEWIQLKGSSSKAPRVRLAHPNKNIGFEGTRKRRREAMGSYKWSVGDRVDAWMRDGWWEGEIKEIIEDGDSKAKVFFPGDGDTSLVKTSKLRPSLVWSNGHWVLWTDAKQGRNEPSKVRSDLHEGETPIAKRQRTEKGQASNASKQKPVGSSIADIAATHNEGSLLDSAAVTLPTDLKGFAVGGIDRPKPQGSKVVFGVPRPTKKRKLIEVSKHYNSARGARSTGTLNVKAASNKHEEAMNAVLGFVAGSSEVSRLDGLKAKKRVLPSQKAKPQKDADSERANSKGNAIRNKKEKPFVDTKTLVRKNPSSREGLPSVPKNKESKVISKKKLPSDKSQLESQKQPEGFPSGDALLQKLSAASGATISEVNKSTSIILEEGGKEPSHAAQKTGKPGEKQTVHAAKETGREPSHVVQASDSRQTSSHSFKEREKQPFQQLKDGEKQPSNPVNGNRQISHPSKKKETQPFVPVEDNEERAQDKESGSQPVQDGKRQLLSLEASREKQPATPVIDIEKQPPLLSKETDKGKDVGKPGSETWEPRRTSRKIQPTSKLLEGLQTAPKLGKNSSSHDKGSRVSSKAHPHL